MRTLYFSLLILLFSNAIFSQKATIDSLRTLLYHTNEINKQIELELELTGLFAQQNIDSTKKYGHSALKKSKQVNNKILQCQSYLKLVFGYGNKWICPKNDTTWLYLDLAERIARQIKYKQGIAKINNVKGVLYFDNGELEKSIKHYLIAEKLFEELKDTLYIGFSKNNIANYYNYAKEYDKALEYLFQSKKIFTLLKQDRYVMSTISNIISIYAATNDTLNLIRTIDEFYPLAQSGEYLQFKILSTDYWGIKFLYQKHYDSAEYYFKKAIVLADSAKNPSLVIRTYINLANVYFKQEKWDKAESHYMLGLEKARKDKSYQTELLAIKGLSEVNQKQGKYKEALQYLTEYKQLLDSTKLELSGSFAEKALSDQELQQKTEELSRLKTEQAGIKNMMTIIYMVSSVLLFLLLWYFQSGILSGFSKPKRADKNSQTFWQYIPPAIIPGNLNLIVRGISFLVLNILFYLIFYKALINLVPFIIWNIFVLALYLTSSWMFSRFVLQKQATLKKELIFLLSGSLLFSFVITLFAILVKPMNISAEHYFSFVLLIIANLFIVHIPASLIQYRNRLEILSENLITMFNSKLEVWKQSIASQKIAEIPKEEIISIDNNGKNVEIKPKNLLYIVSDNVYQEIISIDGEKTTKALVRNTMGNIEKSLAEYKTFLRCHRSYIVNTGKITSIVRKSRQYYFVLDKTNEKIPISRNAENTILENFSGLLNN
jgi:tetratricopeptide (TPR) repeat protein